MKMKTKETMVFLPGWGFHASVWQDIADAMTQHETKLVDLPPWSSNLDEMMDSLLRQIPENAIVVAWSLSALLAIYFSYRYPAHCKKIVIVSALPKFLSDENWNGIDKERATQFLKKAESNMTMLKNEFLQWVCFPAHAKKIQAYLLAHWSGQVSTVAYLQWMFEIDYRRLVETMLTPLVFIFGEKDAIFPLPSREQLQRLNVSIEIKSMPDAGHAPFLTNKAVFMQQLIETSQDG